MKCPVSECDNKYIVGNGIARTLSIHGIKKSFYCGAHGNFDFVDGKWWWWSYFHPHLYLEREAIAVCPKNCFGYQHLSLDNKQVHRGKDGRYYCSDCDWNGDKLPEVK